MNITSDGTHQLISQNVNPDTGHSAVYFSGTLGAATVKCVFLDDDLVAHDYENGAVASLPADFEVKHGRGVSVYVSVSGADEDTDFNVNIAGID